MATGDIKWFSQGLHDLGSKVHNLATDSLYVGLVTSVTPPTIAIAQPHWGGTGTTNFASNQVALGTSYTTGGKLLTGVTWTIVAGVPTLRAGIVTWAQDAGAGFTNALWGILYNGTDANKRALGFIDLGSARSITAGSLTLDWSGATNDVLTITQT
jgi:hypothetical protein